MKKLERIYVDSCIVIELAKYGKKIHRKDRENDLWFVRQMLKAAEEKELEVVTSSLTVTESLFLGYDENKNPIECDALTQEFLINLLISGTLIQLIQPSVLVAERARDLRWKHGLKLKPYDSMHVASALDGECQELLSWDTDMSKEKRAVEIMTLSEMGLRVISPHESRVLPDSYRQVPLALTPPRRIKQLPPPTIQ